ncbi:MAG TPA: nucleotidyltransferase family protein [Hyphomicrobiaceae bacterium]|nr:nucleotidyltransferase family protein [Hyphomicrobiaceae bacterium]
MSPEREDRQALAETIPVAAIVLAAGRSTRMGNDNKLLCEVAGKPLLRHAVESALASAARPVLVVTGHQRLEVEAALAGLAVTVVANPAYASGLASSLKAGIGALPRQIGGALVMLGDMPLVRPAQLDCLIAAFLAAAGRAIIVPTHRGQRGNPVLWPAACFAEMLALKGDAGARQLFAAHGEEIREVPLDAAAILEDIDTPEALAHLRQGLGR